METIIKPIADYPNYRVSNDGRVFRERQGTLTELKQSGNKHRPQVCLYNDYEKKGRPVEILVLEAFVGPKPEHGKAKHLDGDQQNNHVDNLVWTIPIKKVGRWTHITVSQAREVVALAEQGLHAKEIAEKLNIKPWTIYHILSGRTFKGLCEPHVQPRRWLNVDQAEQAKKLREQGYTYEEIADEIDSSKSTIHRLITGKYVKVEQDTPAPQPMTNYLEPSKPPLAQDTPAQTDPDPDYLQSLTMDDFIRFVTDYLKSTK